RDGRRGGLCRYAHFTGKPAGVAAPGPRGAARSPGLLLPWMKRCGGMPANSVGGFMAADLSGRTALITGAVSGIGRASALAFAAAGGSGAWVDRGVDGRARTAAAARRLGPPAEVIQADVTDLRAVGVWRCMRAEIRQMRAQRADAIVNTSSMLGAAEASYITGS